MPLSPEKGRDCSSSLPDLTSTFPLLADDLDEAIQRADRSDLVR